jgi:hypothetical protein
VSAPGATRGHKACYGYLLDLIAQKANVGQQVIIEGVQEMCGPADLVPVPDPPADSADGRRKLIGSRCKDLPVLGLGDGFGCHDRGLLSRR